MSSKTPRNISASIRQRLLNKAKTDGRSFQETVQYYAMERFLYRLSRSRLCENFILKGALMLQVWRFPKSRPTMDIDMLGRTPNDEANISDLMTEIMITDVEPDGLVFMPDSIRTERITEDADYSGIRVLFSAGLDTMRLNMQVDIGFGDIIFPSPEKIALPTILDFPEPELFCYSRESAIAEKFEAMVKLGELNSRMKDFYDIWLLARMFSFEGEKLAKAIRLTFENRDTRFPEAENFISDNFIKTKQVQWSAFRKKIGQTPSPSEFSEVADLLKGFLAPVAFACKNNISFVSEWTVSGHWK